LRDGRPVARCKTCVGKSRRKAYAEDARSRQKVADASKAYRQANKERVRRTKKAYYIANKHEINSRNRARQHLYEDARKSWKARNRERALAATKQWVVENRERYNLVLREHMRARRAKTQGGATPAEVLDWESDEAKICRWCGIVCDDEYEVDHIHPIALGGLHVLENLAIACRPCNRRKGALPLDKWLLKLNGEGAS
jgi:5-methylcytosine-specific restriction endonuclease McrA